MSWWGRTRMVEEEFQIPDVDSFVEGGGDEVSTVVGEFNDFDPSDVFFDDGEAFAGLKVPEADGIVC